MTNLPAIGVARLQMDCSEGNASGTGYPIVDAPFGEIGGFGGALSCQPLGVLAAPERLRRLRLKSSLLP